MKKNHDNLEHIQGGDALDGVCALVGMNDAALGFYGLAKLVLKTTISSAALTPAGVTVMAAANVACVGRLFDVW